MRGVQYMYELLLTVTFIANFIKLLVPLVPIANIDGSYGDINIINCTERSLANYLVEDNKYYPFNLGCVFTFYCPTDCRCTLSDRNMTVDCHNGKSFHSVVYPSTFLNTSFFDDMIYSNTDLNSSTEYNADGEYYDYGASSSKTVIWYNAGLTNITRDAFAAFNRDVEHLMLTRNKITEIQQQQFPGLVYLSGLYLDYNSIVEIQPWSFNGLVNLRNLYLDHNGIFAIHTGSFDGLVKLMYLYLDHNNVVEIYQGSFEGLVELYSLNLEHNSIVEMHPGSFDGLDNLVFLDLDDNSNVEIQPGIFDRLVNLKGLFVERNNILEIHRGSFDGLVNINSLRLNHNSIFEIHPRFFDGLFQLVYLSLGNNNIVEIQPGTFDGLVKLAILYLDHNNIVEIHPGSFKGLVDIKYLKLEYNSIFEIHPVSFDRLVDIKALKMDHNSIVEIHPSLFDGLVDINELYLQHNSIVKIHPGLFDQFFKLEYLQLDHNDIVTLDWHVFKDLYNLRQLTLQNNRITAMHSEHIESLSILEYFDLSHNNLITLTIPLNFSNLKYFFLANNKLTFIQHGAFQRMKNLQYLDLSENSFDRFDSLSYFNNSIGPIEILDLRKNNLYSVNNDSFFGFDSNTSILVDNEATCCFMKSTTCNATIPRSQYLTCGRLLPNLFQRIIMWILGILSLTANISVLRYRYRNRQENRVQVLLISNLSISDMVMGIYMIIIASADLYYKNTFPSEFWRLSFTCKFAGTLSILSSEASVFFVTLISLDRLMGIRYAFSTYRLGSYSSKVLSMMLWMIAIMLSVTSTMISRIDPDWYDVSEVCTGLPLSRRNVYESKFKQYTLDVFDPTSWDKIKINSTYDVIVSHAPGMYYGIAVFIVLNSICFLIVSICYSGIFITVLQTAKQAGRARNIQKERKMATKMGVIVMTDLVCWAPVIILSILVQSGRHIVTPHVYTWIVTFVLPINSAINPFLYTLSNFIFDYINDRQNRSHTLHLRTVSTRAGR